MDDLISRQAAIDALDVLCQEHRYKIPGKFETYSQYNEAWQDALDRAEGAIDNLPTIHSEPQKRMRGRWNTYYHGGTDFSYSCAQCGYSAPFDMKGGKIFQKKWNYCSNCGADMRGENGNG